MTYIKLNSVAVNKIILMYIIIVVIILFQ